MKKFVLFLLLAFFVSCNTLNNDNALLFGKMNLVEGSPMMDDFGKTILERVDAPFGYSRVSVDGSSFANYLRNLPLKPRNAPAQNSNNRVKTNDNIYVCVVDMSISYKNLPSSTNAVIRLISEFFYQNQEYDKIVFHAGKEELNYVSFAESDYSRLKFDYFLETVMEKISIPNFCSDMQTIKLPQVKVGDIFVQNIQPKGHAVIVVDMVENRKGEKLVLLAQSSQPAHEIQLLSNPNEPEISPWYRLIEGELNTPEWRFMTSDLMRFKLLSH